MWGGGQAPFCIASALVNFVYANDFRERIVYTSELMDS
jgi:hypothetical protein